MKKSEVLEAVKNLPFIQMKFDLIAEVSSGIEMIDSIGTLVSVKITENNVNLNDNRNANETEKIRLCEYRRPMRKKGSGLGTPRYWKSWVGSASRTL